MKVEDAVHANLVAFAAYLTMEAKKQVTLSDAIKHLLENASATYYKKEVLEASEAKLRGNHIMAHKTCKGAPK